MGYATPTHAIVRNKYKPLAVKLAALAKRAGKIDARSASAIGAAASTTAQWLADRYPGFVADAFIADYNQHRHGCS